MSGVTLKIELRGIEDVERRLQRLVLAGRDMTPAMESIGEYLARTTRDRFDAEEAPDGTDWAGLKDSTKKRKKRNADKILTLEGYLRGQIVYRATAHSVEVGSALIYAGTHQFGVEKGSFGSTHAAGYRDRKSDRAVRYSSLAARPLPWGDIPARPFLGVSDADRDELTDTLRDYILGT